MAAAPWTESETQLCSALLDRFGRGALMVRGREIARLPGKKQKSGLWPDRPLFTLPESG
jgi:hypothetical protein